MYFMFEYAKHGTLSRLIRKLGSLPPDLARFYAAELVNALEYLHSMGVVHRDLKPENILLDDDIHLKVCDFGDALQLEKGKSFSNETEGHSFFEAKVGTFCGTPLYVSPEMLESSTSSPAGDLWALGVIIY